MTRPKNVLETVLKLNRPDSASMAGWDRWYENLRTSRPVAYFLAVRLPRLVDRLHMRTFGWIGRLGPYLKNGFVTKTHALTATSLKFGAWHELDDRILHGTMDSLTFYVETEISGLWQMGEGKKRARSVRDGLAYLDWASTLSQPESDEDGAPAGGELTRQATEAQEIKRIYLWWTIGRPARIAPSEESGLERFRQTMDDKYPGPPGSTGGFFRRTWHRHYSNTPVLTTEEEAVYGSLIKKTMELETARDNEDDEMLVSLIRIRKGLWS